MKRGKTNLGFSILELMAVMAISAIIMTSLFEIYNQVARNTQRMQTYCAQDIQLVTLQHRFDTDLAGLSAIWFTQAALQAQRDQAQGVQGQQSSGAEQSKQRTSQYFYSVNKQGNFDFLTFVTDNGLQSYGSPQPRFVRIIYKLQQDQQHPGNFRLMRKQIPLVTESIDEKVIEKPKYYQIAGNIASLQLVYHYVDEIELQKQQQEQDKDGKGHAIQRSEQQIQQVLKTTKEWKEDKQEKQKKSKKIESNAARNDEQDQALGGALMPKIIEMKLAFGSSDNKQEYLLQFCVPVQIETVVKELVCPKQSGQVSASGHQIGGAPQGDQA